MGQPDTQAPAAGVPPGQWWVAIRSSAAWPWAVWRIFIWPARAGPTGLQRLWFVKMMQEVYTTSDDHVSMFLDEARIAARLNHPGITQSTTSAKSRAISTWPWSTWRVSRWAKSWRSAGPDGSASPCRTPCASGRGWRRPRLRPSEDGIRSASPCRSSTATSRPTTILVTFDGEVENPRLRHRQGRAPAGPDRGGPGQGQALPTCLPSRRWARTSTTAPTSSRWAWCSSSWRPAGTPSTR